MKKKILSFLLVAIMVISTVCTGNVNVHAAEDKEEIVYKLLGDFEDCLNGYLEAVNSEGKKEVGEINESVDLDELAGLLKAKDSKSSDKHLTFSYITDEARNSAYYVLAQFVASLTDDINLGTIDVNDTNKSAKNLVNYLKDRTVPAEFTKEHGGYKVELKVTGVFSAYTGSVTVTSLNNKSEKYTGIARSTLKETKKVMTSYIDAMSDVVKDGFKKALISVIQELADVTCLDKYTEKELKKYIDKKLKKLQENEFWRKTLAIIVKSNSIYKQVKSLLNGDIVSKMKTGEISTEELFNSLKKLNYYSDEEVRNKIIDKAFKKLRETKEKLETAIFNQIYDTNCKNYDEYKEKSEDKSLKKAVPLTLKTIKKTLYAGDADSSFKLTASIPANELTWSSTNKKVATVTDDGLVEAVKSGVAVIKVQIGSRKADCTITVKSPALNKKEETLNVGGTLKLKMNGSNVKSFTSSDKKVATVSKSGVVTAKKAGKAVISAKCSDGKTYKCTITVNKKKKNNENKVTPTPEKTNEETVSLKKGDYITLGKYEQDNDLDNGKEPIEWEVLDIKDGKALVISKYILDIRPYFSNVSHYYPSWLLSDLRFYLEGDFYNDVFNESEKQLINEVVHENTTDKIFCLSVDEIIKYFEFEEWYESSKSGYSKDLLAESTPYALKNGEELEDYNKMPIGGRGCWWLRSGAGGTSQYFVYSNGRAGEDNSCKCSYCDVGVRPAMWISINDYVQYSDIIKHKDSKSEDVSTKTEKKIITFGTYEQDNNTENGKEPIEWEILDIKDGKALIISKYILTSGNYNRTENGITWEKCTLREFLNEDFYDEAFTEKEKQLICGAVLDNNNLYTGLTGRNKTNDKVFCLSVDEVLKYFKFETWDMKDTISWISSELITECTPYVLGYGNSANSTDDLRRDWWLRTPGHYGDTACLVTKNGKTSLNSYLEVNERSLGVRPAMWISINEILSNTDIDNTSSTDGIRKTITLGTYEQDWDAENGAIFTNKPIEWEVLAEEGNKALVITKKVIDVAPYNNENTDVTWENSSLRRFLNEEFYNKAFSSEEKELINQVTLENKDNSYYGTVGGNNTNDKVFCLSMDEIKKYYKSVEWSTQFTYGESWNLVSECTDYTRLEKKADSVQVSTVADNISISYDAGYWWLRSPGAGRDKACIVKGNIVGSQTYSDVNDSKVGIRPAMWISFGN